MSPGLPEQGALAESGAEMLVEVGASVPTTLSETGAAARTGALASALSETGAGELPRIAVAPGSGVGARSGALACRCQRVSTKCHRLWGE